MQSSPARADLLSGAEESGQEEGATGQAPSGVKGRLGEFK